MASRPITNAPTSGTFTTDDTVHAEITLTNTGERKGTEVAQLYIGDIVTSYSWTDRELKAFQRVELEPGETKTVAFDIPVSELHHRRSGANRIVEPGEFEVLIGHRAVARISSGPRSPWREWFQLGSGRRSSSIVGHYPETFWGQPSNCPPNSYADHHIRIIGGNQR